MLSVQTIITQNDLKRYPRGVVPASLVRQRLIEAGAPEGFNMTDVVRSDLDGHISFVWSEPVQIGDHPQPHRLPPGKITCSFCGEQRSQYPDEECTHCQAVVI